MAKTVKLQGVYGEQPAKEVKALKIGDIITWNYGYKSMVINIVASETGKTFDITLKSLDSDYIGTRKMGATRLVVA